MARSIFCVIGASVTDKKRGAKLQEAFRELKTFAKGRKEVSLTVNK